jgi:hypothetical protein
MYISTIRKIAPETANAAAKRLVMAVALRGAKRPKLMKTTTSQKTIVPSKLFETEVFDCSNINQRILPIFIGILRSLGLEGASLVVLRQWCLNLVT